MKVIFVGNYRNQPQGLVFAKDQVVDLDEELLGFIERDAPGIFREKKQVGRPPKNKMVGSPEVDK